MDLDIRKTEIRISIELKADLLNRIPKEKLDKIFEEAISQLQIAYVAGTLKESDYVDPYLTKRKLEKYSLNDVLVCDRVKPILSPENEKMLNEYNDF